LDVDQVDVGGPQAAALHPVIKRQAETRIGQSAFLIYCEGRLLSSSLF
jgi:hypothetical protein